MDLSLVRDNGKVAVVTCGPLLSLADLSAGSDPLVAILGKSANSRRVLLDLGQTQHADSSGIAWLLAANRRCAAAGGKLVLFAVPPPVRELMRMLHIESLLALADDEASARAL
jgi:anti-anti-sigma factor